VAGAVVGLTDASNVGTVVIDDRLARIGPTGRR
jgi:hypothetical protein